MATPSILALHIHQNVLEIRAEQRRQSLSGRRSESASKQVQRYFTLRRKYAQISPGQRHRHNNHLIKRTPSRRRLRTNTSMSWAYREACRPGPVMRQYLSDLAHCSGGILSCYLRRHIGLDHRQLEGDEVLLLPIPPMTHQNWRRRIPPHQSHPPGRRQQRTTHLRHKRRRITRPQHIHIGPQIRIPHPGLRLDLSPHLHNLITHCTVFTIRGPQTRTQPLI